MVSVLNLNVFFLFFCFTYCVGSVLAFAVWIQYGKALVKSINEKGQDTLGYGFYKALFSIIFEFCGGKKVKIKSEDFFRNVDNL